MIESVVISCRRLDQLEQLEQHKPNSLNLQHLHIYIYTLPPNRQVKPPTHQQSESSPRTTMISGTIITRPPQLNSLQHLSEAVSRTRSHASQLKLHSRNSVTRLLELRLDI
jgi:hypothetical protein